MIEFPCRALQNWLQMPFLMLFPKIQMVLMTNQQGQVGKRIWSGAILTILGFFSHSSFSFISPKPVAMNLSLSTRQSPAPPAGPAGLAVQSRRRYSEKIARSF